MRLIFRFNPCYSDKCSFFRYFIQNSVIYYPYNTFLWILMLLFLGFLILFILSVLSIFNGLVIILLNTSFINIYLICYFIKFLRFYPFTSLK